MATKPRALKRSQFTKLCWVKRRTAVLDTGKTAAIPGHDVLLGSRHMDAIRPIRATPPITSPVM